MESWPGKNVGGLMSHGLPAGQPIQALHGPIPHPPQRWLEKITLIGLFYVFSSFCEDYGGTVTKTIQNVWYVDGTLILRCQVNNVFYTLL